MPVWDWLRVFQQYNEHMALAALLSLLFTILGLVLAITWIVFPFIVISKCNQLARIAGAIHQELKSIRAETKPAASPPSTLPLPRSPLRTESLQPQTETAHRTLPPLPKTGPSLHHDTGLAIRAETKP